MTGKIRGFTLMEILVVIVITATLVGIGVPVSRSAIAKSREAACLNNLRALGVATESYLQDHNNIMPTLFLGRSSKTEDVPVIETALLEYVGSPEAFHCPADRELYEKSGSSYVWNTTQNGRLRAELYFFGNDEFPERIPLISDKESWHPSGVNFLYADLSSSNKQRFAVGN